MADGESYSDFPDITREHDTFHYFIEVYINNFMSLIIPVSKSQLLHSVTAIMTGIYNVFHAKNADNGEDPLSEKKLLKQEGQEDTTWF